MCSCVTRTDLNAYVDDDGQWRLVVVVVVVMMMMMMMYTSSFQPLDHLTSTACKFNLYFAKSFCSNFQ